MSVYFTSFMNAVAAEIGPIAEALYVSLQSTAAIATSLVAISIIKDCCRSRRPNREAQPDYVLRKGYGRNRKPNRTAQPDYVLSKDERCIHKWLHSDKEISLLLDGTRLGYKVIQSGETIGKGPLSLPPELENLPLPVKLNYIISKTLLSWTYKGTLKISFCGSQTYFQKVFGDKVLRLHLCDNTLVWVQFDRFLNSTSLSFISEKSCPNGGTLPKLSEWELQEIGFQTHRYKQDEDIENTDDILFRIQNSIIKKVKIDCVGDLCVGLDPIEVPSRMGSVTINSRVWAVTLIAIGQGSQITDSIGCSSHGELVIEGIKEGKYFLKLAHFVSNKKETGKPGVILSDIFREQLRYQGKTETWPRPRKLVQAMLDKISLEDSGQEVPDFHIFGRNSIFSRGRDNCTTWIAQKLSIAKVVLPSGMINWIVTTPNDYISTQDAADRIHDLLEQQGITELNKESFATVLSDPYPLMRYIRGNIQFSWWSWKEEFFQKIKEQKFSQNDPFEKDVKYQERYMRIGNGRVLCFSREILDKEKGDGIKYFLQREKIRGEYTGPYHEIDKELLIFYRNCSEEKEL